VRFEIFVAATMNGMWLRVVWYTVADISEECAAYFFRV
jgi:hypothetical protein